MKIYTSLALASLAAAQADSTYHDPLKVFTLRRSYLTCQETYGGGSEICGDPATSHYCYDPTLGDTCCLLDNGYCKKGDFCAPVQGYCCHDGEDPETCSLRLGFTLPPNLAADAASLSLSSSSPLTSTIAISLAAAAVSDSPILAPSSEASTTDTRTATTAATTAMAVGLGVVGSTTVTGMTPEFTAPLNQTGGLGNATGVAVETGGGGGGGGASGTGIGTSGNGSVPATEQFTGAGAEGRSIGHGLVVVGMLLSVAVLFGSI